MCTNSLSCSCYLRQTRHSSIPLCEQIFPLPAPFMFEQNDRILQIIENIGRHQVAFRISSAYIYSVVLYSAVSWPLHCGNILALHLDEPYFKLNPDYI